MEDYLDGVLRKKRTCLICGELFASYGSENRRCEYCERWKTRKGTPPKGFVDRQRKKHHHHDGDKDI